MTRPLAVAGTAALVISLAFACAPIVGAPLSGAPLNAGCPDENSCDAYVVPNAKTKAQCNKGRCEYGRPAYEFTVVINVPDSSVYAAGRTFVLSSADLNPQGAVTATGSCPLPTCVQLPQLEAMDGKYTVTHDASVAVGQPLDEGTSLPVNVSYFPVYDSVQAGVPARPIVMASRTVRPQPGLSEVSFIDPLVVGRYQRFAYPQPPFDEAFPPAISAVLIVPVFPAFPDRFILGDPTAPTDPKTPLDDKTGVSRMATVTRAEGLDGWHAWLVDAPTQRRISSLRTLSGTTASVRLDTVGRHQSGSTVLDDDVEVIVAPPETWVAVPRLQSKVINGAGLDNLKVPSLPAPATVRGDVAHAEGTVLTSISSRVTFVSTGLLPVVGDLQPLLHYSTTVTTDEAGHFMTVLPPGTYEVTIEPVEGTGFSKVKDTFDTANGLSKTYHPPRRTTAMGRVLLADGRPLAEADIFALPSDVPIVGTAVSPRPAHARTDPDGTFRFEVDQGQYDLRVDPQAGTGFPRVVQLRSFGTGTVDIGDVQIPPPARLAFTIKDPSNNTIANAIVQVFALPSGRGAPAVEIGRALTTADPNGNCEILLAQQAP